MEVGLAQMLLRTFAGMRLETDVVEDNEDRRVYVRHVPLGVGVGLVPWNWPLLLAIGKVGPDLITGNTLIVKPSPFTPYVGLKLGELAANIFPPGVLQVLSGGDNLGPMLTEHPGVDKVSFMGSTATGMKVMKSCAGTLKRISLELGGNDAAIVCASADLEKSVDKIGQMALMSSGQICMNMKRIYVHESIYDTFRDRLTAYIKNLKTSPASDGDTFVGPVQNKMQYDKVQSLFAEIADRGWTPSCGGHAKKDMPGFFFEPTLMDNPPDDARIVTEEPFGPILPILTWKDEDDVITRTNNTKMGLGASVWTQNIEEGERVQLQLEAGSVWLNTHFEISPTVPFGGHKWSGIGMEWGQIGLKGWCNPQCLVAEEDVNRSFWLDIK